MPADTPSEGLGSQAIYSGHGASGFLELGAMIVCRAFLLVEKEGGVIALGRVRKTATNPFGTLV